mgnify:CR=1 FL=1|tara:strand:- start:2141 stop:2428 length:288 start_codon:yes stop_codon:yes gene_type:complete
MEEEDIKELFCIRNEFRDKGISKLELMNTHQSFYTKYEKCFEMICDVKCDDDILNRIVNARKSVMSGSTSQHDASVAVGQNLVDKYVIPRVSPNK